MKKSILLLTATALLSLGTLGACNDEPAPTPAPSSSEEVDPEASWPEHEWSTVHKAAVEEKFGAGIADLIPFYYFDDTELKVGSTQANSVYSNILYFHSSHGDASDILAYRTKLIKAGFEQCYDSSATKPHYRKQLSKSKVSKKYLDIAAYLDSGFNIDFIVGDELVDYSVGHADVDVDEAGTLFAGIGQAAVAHFEALGYKSANPGFNDLVMPTGALPEGNTITQIDYLDYGAYISNYFGRYSHYLFNYVKPYDLSTYIKATSLPADYSVFNLRKEVGEIVFTSSARTASDLQADQDKIVAKFVESGWQSLSNLSGDNSLCLRRNGYEIKFVQQEYYVPTSTEAAYPASIKALISYELLHNYGGTYHEMAAGVGAVNACFNEYTEESVVIPTLTPKAGTSLYNTIILDNRYNAMIEELNNGTLNYDPGYIDLKVSIIYIADTEEEVRNDLGSSGWDYHAAEGDNAEYYKWISSDPDCDIRLTLTYTGTSVVNRVVYNIVDFGSKPAA